MQRHKKTKLFKDWIGKQTTEDLDKLKSVIHKKRYNYLHYGIGSGNFQLSRDEAIFHSYDSVYNLILREIRSRG